MASTKKLPKATNILAQSSKISKTTKKNIFWVIAILFLSYTIASTLAVVVANILAGTDVKSGISPKASSSITLPKRPFINYRNLQKSIVNRNIFNSSGEVPDESSPDNVQDNTISSDFNENAPCEKSSLALSLLGTIAQKSKDRSIATIQEQGFNQADIYRIGDSIIGHDGATLYAIFHQKVVINNNGKKECLEIEKGKLADRLSIEAPVIKPIEVGIDVSGSNTKEIEDKSHIVLKNSYVESALGPGFSKILATGRLVPYNNGQRMQGFRLVAVKAESIWTKLGLNNGDVLVRVNKTDMTRPDQGFGLYQALSEEQLIRLEYMKNGEIPSTLTIEIK